MGKSVAGLGLLSGGLDSQLAVRVLQAQGVPVKAVVFEHPFYDARPAHRAAEALAIELIRYDFTDEILGLLENPPHGFGKCLNPCIDCHSLMFRRARELMDEQGCGFLFSGEVLNERPMSQTNRGLSKVSATSACGELILRPLSAKLLPETKPEREGWVDREQLLDLNGRRRARQFALAEEMGVEEYPYPAGGCLLTDPPFCVRLQEQRGFPGEGLSARSAWRLRYGRHFRLPDGSKLILGRDQGDNLALEGLADDRDWILAMRDRMGPTGLLPRDCAPETVRVAGAICAFYAKVPAGEGAIVCVDGDGMGRREIDVIAGSLEQARELLIT